MYIRYVLEDIQAIRDKLVDSQRTIAVAESVTSGLLQGAFSQAEDARLFFQGGVTAYNVAQKFRHLGVEPIHAENHNGVSARIAQQMATGVAASFRSHLGIGVVGYAAPVPEKKIDEPYAFYSIYEGGQLLDTARIEGYDAQPLELQLYYVTEILKSLRRILG